jgi:hypothetical protein
LDDSQKTPETTLVVNTPEQAQWLKEQVEGKSTQNKALKNALENYKEAQKNSFDQLDRSL